MEFSGRRLPPDFIRNGRSILSGLKKGEALPKYALCAVRDPLIFDEDVSEVFARELTNVRRFEHKALLTMLTGTYKDTEVLICSTSTGAPDAEVAVCELFSLGGVDTLIRVGSSGTHRRDVQVGDLAISAGAVRDDGLTRDYIAPQFPAVASYEVVLAMVEAAQRAGVTHHVGITRSNDSIFAGQGRAVAGYIQPEQAQIIEYWDRANILNIDRETSAILTLTQLFGLRGGSMCIVSNSSAPLKVGVSREEMQRLIHISLEAVALLGAHDRRKQRCAQPYYAPSIEEKA